jgi:hypothetical protein
MAAARFHFSDDWLVPAAPEQVAGVLLDMAMYPMWWPEVLAVADLGHDRARVLCRSRLPYTLDLVLTAVRRTSPLEVAVAGDLEGWVRIDLRAEGVGTRLVWQQEASLDGWRAYAGIALRPLLEWNHAQMVAGLRTSLTPRVRHTNPTQ